jgi:thiaminase
MFRTRATEGGFHFKVPRRFIFDRYCTEPKTNQATVRELETFAYQLHLMRLAGYKVDDQQFMNYSARLMQYMHDWWWIPGKGDDERAAFCFKRIAEHYASTTSAEVVDRLEAWLDATAKRLKRKKLDYPATWPEASVRKRYHADGHVWVC